ncbi:MAG: proteasome accessory factor PafA2 family protein, partial [Bifidobacterium sp.]|nr:proteasome accessory factor PafA2 family protein [Bifidobacterium sp.]
MSVRRVMGTEMEYGVQGRAGGNPVQWSFDVVAGASTPATEHIRWDYGAEDPVNDLRGTRLPRANADPDLLTDAPQLRRTNVAAGNGARIYVDHAHPEYAAPETLDPFEAVRWDGAGDLLMADAAARASAATGEPLALYRTTVDGKGASWGCHENYLLDRAVPFGPLSRLLMAHFATRQQYAGAGRIGLGERGGAMGYQLSQRADYVHMKVGLQTTFDRPLVNTRDEPHAPADRRRLHVIVGDANRMDVPRVLKLGTTSLLLWVCEHADEAGIDLEDVLARVELA